MTFIVHRYKRTYYNTNYFWNVHTFECSLCYSICRKARKVRPPHHHSGHIINQSCTRCTILAAQCPRRCRRRCTKSVRLSACPPYECVCLLVRERANDKYLSLCVRACVALRCFGMDHRPEYHRICTHDVPMQMIAFHARTIGTTRRDHRPRAITPFGTSLPHLFTATLASTIVHRHPRRRHRSAFCALRANA